MKKFGQYLRKLVPIRYRQTVIENGSCHRCDWWAWFGCRFALKQTAADQPL